MRTTDTVITKRASALGTWEVPLGSALLAADASAPDGFRPADVRFYFLLFTNWMGDDHLRPGADLDPTQVRRALTHLAGERLARNVKGPTWALEPAGVLHLVEAITDPRAPRRFEEVVLLATVAASYAETIGARVAARPSDERRVRARLDPRAILRAERRRLADALVDVEERRDAGPVLAAAAAAALRAGADPVEVASRLEGQGFRYRLHPVRPLHEVLAALPPALRRFELEEGLTLRARAMFAPLCEDLRARIGILERLEEELR